MVQAIGSICFAIGMVVSCLAWVVLIAPRAMGVVHRIYALPLGCFLAGVAGAFSIVFPRWTGDQTADDSRAAGAVLLTFWALTVLIAMFVASRSKDELARIGFWKGLQARWVKRQANVVAAAGSQNVEPDTAEARTQREKINVTEMAKYRRQVAADKLIAEHERTLRRDEAEGRATQQRIDSLSLPHKSPRKTRKPRLSDKEYQVSISREGFEAYGKWARFEYVDADGVVTNRHIVQWERRGGYIVGFDTTGRGQRTFRQDRISEWLAG